MSMLHQENAPSERRLSSLPAWYADRWEARYNADGVLPIAIAAK